MITYAQKNIFSNSVACALKERFAQSRNPNLASKIT
jgi:hypothetical protein